jgi:hypothetical protein
MASGAAPGAVFQLWLPKATERILSTIGAAENALREEEREGRSCKRVASRGSRDSVVGQILVVA